MTVSSIVHFPVSSEITESSEKEFPSPNGSSESSIKVPVSVKKPTIVDESSMITKSSVVHGTSYSSSIIVDNGPSSNTPAPNKGGNTQKVVKSSSSTANTNGNQAAGNNGNQGTKNTPAPSPDSAEKKGNNQKGKLSQTGENSSITLVGLGVLSIIGLGFVLEKRK